MTGNPVFIYWKVLSIKGNNIKNGWKRYWTKYSRILSYLPEQVRKTFYLTCRSAPIRFLSERYIAIKITGHYMPKVYSTNSLPFWETSLIIAYTLKNMTGRWYLQKKIKLSIGEKIQKWMCVSFLILLFHLVRKKLH